ncbi:MAG: superoxide dismutase, partial [Flammeovirgaceae bacterium]
MITNRREFVKGALKVTAVGAIASAINPTELFAAAPIKFAQVKLSYDYAALEPYIDAMTMEIHYSKHHATYVKNANEAVAADKITFENEADFFANTSRLSVKARNNGGGVYNHNFFWQVMKPNGGGVPTGKLAEAINGA